MREIYRPSMALLTDLYQLTMAYGYWQQGMSNQDAVFNLFFRRNPFKGGYAVACGLNHVIDLLETLHFSDEDITYLGSLTGNDEKALFSSEFLEFLSEMRFECDVAAVPEGTLVFPHEPLLRIRGPLFQVQLIETPLLNLVNFQTLIATKASRICHAAKGEPVLEFGLRRAQGADGALAASRAAYVGGCSATSNVLAGRLFDIPVKGTHAHSWVMSFDSEEDAFIAYAEAMPNNCVFLVDTYDTVEGVRKAVRVGHMLRARGHEMLGVRLDSGDLADLSIKARQILDEGGFPDAAVVASNDLDEHVIESLKHQGATIAVWGVGTRLATAYDQPALGGVYKLSAIRNQGEPWQYKIKLSEQPIKISIPGIQQVRRFYNSEGIVEDVIYDQEVGLETPCVSVDTGDITRQRVVASDLESRDLLVPVFDGGKLVYERPDIHAVRAHCQAELDNLGAGVRRFLNPHYYPVGVERRLHQIKLGLIEAARRGSREDAP